MSLTYVTITGTFEDGSGAPLSGYVQFVPSAVVEASGIPVLQPGVPVTAQISGGQLASVRLLATDNSGLVIEGQTGFFYWSVSVVIGGETLPSWSFFLPSSPSTVDLYSLANTPAGGGGGGIHPPAGDIGGTATAPTVVSAHLSAPLPLAQGGTAQNAASSSALLTALGALQAAGNLSDVTSAATARTNLGLGSAATQSSSAFDAAGAAAAAQSAAEAASVPLSALPLPLGDGGTGQTTQQAALDALAGSHSSGQYLRGNGTHVQMSAVQPGDLGATPGSTPAAYLPLLYGAVWGYPWQFLPESYGGKADGRLVSDGAMTNGQAVLACTSSAPFTSTGTDGGKPVIVTGAGAGGGPLLTTITSVTDSAHAVLAANAATTVTASGVIFGSDNTAAVKAAQAAGVAYAQGGYGRQEAEILFSPELRVVAGAATIGGGTLGNSIFPRPVIAATAPKLSLTYRCADPVDAAALPHWLQAAPQALGACLAVLRLDGTLDGTFGPASVFGGPLSGYGGSEGGVFNNVQTVVDGISLLLPGNSTFGGWDFYGDAECLVKNGSAFCMAVVPSGAAWPQYNPAGITNQWSYGLRMPSQGNNARCDVGHWSAYGLTYGFMPSEHATADSVRCNYNITGIEGYATGTHGARVKYAVAERNINGLGFRDGVCYLDIETLDVEANTQTIYDPSSFGNGTIGVRGLSSGYVTGIANGGAGLRILNLNNEPGAVTSPQAAPGTGTAWPNGYGYPAEITLSVSGGTLSALTVTGPSGAVSQAVPASTAFYRFTLPVGASYTPVFTGTLTHTVTLL